MEGSVDAQSLELCRRPIVEGGVQPVVVEPSDVFDDRELRLKKGTQHGDWDKVRILMAGKTGAGPVTPELAIGERVVSLSASSRVEP